MRYFALLSKQGTACIETVLTEAEYNDPATRAAIEHEAESDARDDRPVLGTWTDVTENEACNPETEAEARSGVVNEAGDVYEVDANNFLVDGVLIKVDLDQIIERDLEGFLDMISEDAGFPLLMAQTWVIEGHEGEDTVLLRVRGDVSMYVEDDEPT